MTTRKKLIEVALPLEAINAASAREKSIRHGHPSTLHLWWARRPLAAARAVIFAQMVDDPSSYPDLFPTEKAQQKERERLFHIIEDLVKWENTTNEEVLQRARDEIWNSWRRTCAENADHPHAAELFDRNKLPAFHDPFAGGGSIPLEAQRLGLEAWASDLNPVAVLINKAMIEIPPKFAGQAPVNPEARKNQLIAKTWKGAAGLAEDVRYYGQWMRDEAEKRIGHLYPKVKITDEMIVERPDLAEYRGRELTVIAWIWARTVKSPNPAFANIDVPLASTFMLSTKPGKEAYVEPVIENGGYRFTVKVGKPKDPEKCKIGTKSGGSGTSFLCLLSNTPIPFEYIRSEAKLKRMGSRLMAIVAEGDKGRVYLEPILMHDQIARNARPSWYPDVELPERALGFRVQEYGMTKWGDLFTPRQLVALDTFSDLVQEAIPRIERDAVNARLANDGCGLDKGGLGARAYAEAVGVYLGLSVSKCTNRSSSIATYKTGVQCPGDTFGRQAIPMSWDYAESNILCGPSGSFSSMVETTVSGILAIGNSFIYRGISIQADATTQFISLSKIISTDPPYYDNIPYADLSDFFYIWLRRSVKSTFPELFTTLTVPKAEELVANSYRHGGKEKAEIFFINGMTNAMQHLAGQAHPAFPITIYYAFKQSESEVHKGTSSTGWETFLEAVIRAGFSISGTWPVRTERENRKRNQRSNALSSSIVLVCRKRSPNAPISSRREFISKLRSEIPRALKDLQRGNIAPVDLAQAAIGPGMAIFTQYEKVLDAEGNPLSVRDALTLINQTLDETIAEQEGDYDAESRWALAWFEQYGFSEGEFGVAETLSKAKDTSIQRMVASGILFSGKGRVRLRRPSELDESWDPQTDTRLSTWEMVHQLIRILEKDGENATAKIVQKLGSDAESARELCYRLYTICERKKRAQEALSYNSLVQSWPEIERLAKSIRKPSSDMGELFEQGED